MDPQPALKPHTKTTPRYAYEQKQLFDRDVATPLDDNDDVPSYKLSARGRKLKPKKGAKGKRKGKRAAPAATPRQRVRGLQQPTAQQHALVRTK